MKKKMVAKACKSVKNCWCLKSIQERLLHYHPELKLLNEASPKRRTEILRNATPCLVRLLCESGLNVLKGNINLKDDQYEKLKPHKRLLLFVSKPAISLKQRREALTKKKGGFLPVILPTLLSAIAGFAGQTLARYI